MYTDETLLLPVPTINIFVPSVLNFTDVGLFSFELTLKLSTKVTVDDKSNPVERYIR